MGEGMRFVVTRSVFGGPAIFDRETGMVSALVNDVWLLRVLASCVAGGRGRFVWRSAYTGEPR